jgi:hypothetical protein
MPIIPFPEWAPDQPDFNPPGSAVIRNCTPLTSKSYGPMPTPQPYSSNGLTARCQGSYSIKDASDAVYIFAGDKTKLYVIPPSAEAFADASRTTGGAYNTLPVISGGAWSMTAFGKRVIASNYIDDMQTILLGQTHFSQLSPTAPKAKFVTTVKDFLFAANTQDGVDGAVPFRVWWSGLGNPALWPVAGSVQAQQAQSDYQDLQQTDLGSITGLASGFLGNADVAIFCERGIWTANYVGPPILFSFRVVSGAPGSIAPLSIVPSRTRGANGAVLPAVFYLGEDGFQAFTGDAAVPIGAQKFDREFFRECNGQFLHYVQGVADPASKLIFWAFASEVSKDGLFDRVLVYNWELGRAVVCEMNPETNHGEWLTRNTMYANAYNLEELDQFGDLEVIRPSFDDRFWVGDQTSRLSMFRADHTLATWAGPAMGPTLDIPELQPFPGRRTWVTNVRPLIDGGVTTATVQVGQRDRLADPVIWRAEVPINIIGDCPQRYSGRYIRLRLHIPPGQVFDHLQGLDVTMHPGGTMR